MRLRNNIIKFFILWGILGVLSYFSYIFLRCLEFHDYCACMQNIISWNFFIYFINMSAAYFIIYPIYYAIIFYLPYGSIKQKEKFLSILFIGFFLLVTIGAFQIRDKSEYFGREIYADLGVLGFSLFLLVFAILFLCLFHVIFIKKRLDS